MVIVVFVQWYVDRNPSLTCFCTLLSSLLGMRIINMRFKQNYHSSRIAKPLTL